MEVSKTAVEIASLGIQECQSLLSYYQNWKDHKTEIATTYDRVADLGITLSLLKSFIEDGYLNQTRVTQVKICIQSCEDGLTRLSMQCGKLPMYVSPKRLKQSSWAGMERLSYAFRKSTLAKLRDTVNEVQARLSLACFELQAELNLQPNPSHRSPIYVPAEASIEQVATQNQRLLYAYQAYKFRRILDWLSPSNPWTNHASARQSRQPETGAWLLQSEQYQRWKAGKPNFLWLHGKAGCGKTILCSTVIEDMRQHYQTAVNSGYAVFYFSFSDSQKQSHEDLVLSLVSQLGWKDPGLSMLLRAYENPNQEVPGTDDLEKILLHSIESYDEVTLLLDALDECPEGYGVRQGVLEGLERLSQRTSNLRIFATSREVVDVRECMEALGAEAKCIETRSMDTDIQRYISTELSRDPDFRRLDRTTKALIEQTISQRAGGIFRLAHCQLRELKKLGSTRPKYVKAALLALPPTLDDIYERILYGIAEIFRDEALILLRWLVYARSPPSLSELAEAAIINPNADIEVDMANRGPLETTLGMLSGLLVIEVADRRSEAAIENAGAEDLGLMENHIHLLRPAQRLERDIRIRLAHYSVKEFLESNRILHTKARSFHLESAKEHRFLAQSCLAYLMHYANSSEKVSTDQDLIVFPLLEYAAQSWYFHSASQQPDAVNREVALLVSENARRNWLLVHQPDRSWIGAFGPSDSPSNTLGSGLYYASFVGLQAVVSELIQCGSDVNAQGGEYGNALQAASVEGHGSVVEMLINAGAEVNTQGGEFSNALQAASFWDHEEVVKQLINAGADIDADGGPYGSALQAVSWEGNTGLVKILVDAGANVNAKGGVEGSALHAASAQGHDKVVKMLIERGVDVNAQGGKYGHALQAASAGGHEVVVETLIDEGADVNAHGGKYGYAVLAASAMGRQKVMKMLIERGANKFGTENVPHVAKQEKNPSFNADIMEEEDRTDEGGQTDTQAQTDEGGDKISTKLKSDPAWDIQTADGSLLISNKSLGALRLSSVTSSPPTLLTRTPSAPQLSALAKSGSLRESQSASDSNDSLSVRADIVTITRVLSTIEPLVRQIGVFSRSRDERDTDIGLAEHLGSFSWELRKHARSAHERAVCDLILEQRQGIAELLAQGAKHATDDYESSPIRAESKLLWTIPERDLLKFLSLESSMVSLLENLGDPTPSSRSSSRTSVARPIDAETATIVQDLPTPVLWSFTCVCGEVVEDVYDEYVAGAVASAFESLPGQRKSSPAVHHSTIGQFIHECQATITQRLGALATSLLLLLPSLRRLRARNSETTGSLPTDVEIEQRDSGTERYLFVCFTKRRRYDRTEMVPICMNFSCDNNLFVLLKKKFEERTGPWRRVVGFKRLTDIRFVKFQITIHLLVEIYLHSGMRDRMKDAFPPPRHPDYHYQPRPMTMHPAVGHNLLMHFYECPKACKESDFCVRRFPKHATCGVEINEDTQEAFAWGIELVEGIDWAYFWILGLIVIIASTTFGVVWASKKGSIQDAFTIAAYMIAVFAFLGGAMQVAFDYI